MVFTNFIARAITKALSDYLKPECFNNDSLRLGIWSGHVELSNVCLKEDILDPLGLPITLRFARIGRIEVTVPWTHLGRKPVVIKVQEVHVLAHTKYEWEERSNARRLDAIKRSLLAASEFAAAAHQGSDLGGPAEEDSSSPASSSFSNHWLFNRLLNKVLDLIQVEVNDVHIRFEDFVSSPTLPFCMGVTLEAFQLGAQDRTLLGSATQAPRRFIFSGGGHQPLGPSSSTDVLKVAKIEHLSIYCNPVNDDDLVAMAMIELKDDQVDVMLGQLIPRRAAALRQRKRERLKEQAGSAEGLDGFQDAAAEIEEEDGKEKEEDRGEEEEEEEGEEEEHDDDRVLGGHRFLLHPLDSISYFYLGSQTPAAGQDRTSSVTRVMRATLGLEGVKITLEDHLLRSLIYLSAGLVRFENLEKLGVRRPSVSAVENPRAWWRYAYEVVLVKIHEHKGKYDWGAVLRRRKERIKYIKLWKERCSQQGVGGGGAGEEGEEKADPEEQAKYDALTDELKEMEKHLQNRDILSYRRSAEKDLRVEGIVALPAPLSVTTAKWRRLLGAVPVTVDPDLGLEAGPSYVGLVIRLEIAMQDGELRLAAGPKDRLNCIESLGRKAFLRALCHDLVVTVDADSVVGLQNMDVKIDEIRLEGRAIGELGQEGSAGEWTRLIFRRQQQKESTSIQSAPHSPTSGGRPVLHFKMQSMPAGCPYAADIQLKFDAIEAAVVPTAPWLNSALTFVDLPGMADSWVDLEMVALSNFSDWKEQANAKIEYIIRTQQEVRIRIDVLGPLLVILPPAEEPDAPQIHFEIESLVVKSTEGKSRRGLALEALEDDLVGLPMEEDAFDSEENLHQLQQQQEEEAEESWEGGHQQTLERLSSDGSNVELHKMYDNMVIHVTGVRIDLVPSRHRTYIPLLEPLFITTSLGMSRLPNDPQFSRLIMDVQTGEVHFKISAAIIRHLSRLAIVYIKSTQTMHRDFETVRKDVLKKADEEKAKADKLSSFVNLSPTRRRRSERENGLVEGMGSHNPSSSSLSKSSSLSANVFQLLMSPGWSPGGSPDDYTSDYWDARSVTSAVSSMSRKSSYRRQRSASILSAKTARSRLPHQSNLSGIRNYGNGDAEEEEDEKEGTGIQAIEEACLSDEEAFDKAFASAESFEDEEEDENTKMTSSRAAEFGGGAVNGSQYGVAAADEEAGGGEEGKGLSRPMKRKKHGFRNFKLMRAFLCMPKLQFSFWSDSPSISTPDMDSNTEGVSLTDEPESLSYTSSRALVTMSVVGSNLSYHGDTFFHRLRFRLEDGNVACRGAPADMPLLRLGTAALPTPSSYAPETPERLLDISQGHSVPRSLRRNTSMGSVRSMLMDLPDPPPLLPPPGGGERTTLAADVLVILVLDHDPKVTQRPFNSLLSQVQLANLASYVDQIKVAELLKVTKSLMEVAKGFTDDETALVPVIMSQGEVKEQQQQSGTAEALPIRLSTPAGSRAINPQAPHLYFKFSLQDSKLALVSSGHAPLSTLTVGQTSLVLKEREDTSILSCSFRVKKVALEVIEEGTMFLYQVLSQQRLSSYEGGEAAAEDREWMVDLGAVISTSLLFPPPPGGVEGPVKADYVDLKMTLNGLSVLLPARALLRTAKTVLNGPLVLMFLPDQAVPAASPALPSSAASTPSRPSSTIPAAPSLENTTSANQSALTSAAVPMERPPPVIKANLLLPAIALSVPIDGDVVGGWQEDSSLVIRVHSIEALYESPDEVEAKEGHASIDLKYLALEQSGSDKEKRFISLAGAAAFVDLPVGSDMPSAVDMKVARINGDVEATSISFLLALKDHVNHIMATDFEILKQSTAGLRLMAPSSSPPGEALEGQASRARSEGGLSSWGLNMDLTVRLASGGMDVSVDAGSAGVLLLDVGEVNGAIAVHAADGGDLVAEASVGQVRVLYRSREQEKQGDTFHDVITRAGPEAVSSREKSIWENISGYYNSRRGETATVVLGLLPLSDTVIPHLWLRASLGGSPMVRASLVAYAYATDWIITLNGLKVIHEAMQMGLASTAVPSSSRSVAEPNAHSSSVATREESLIMSSASPAPPAAARTTPPQKPPQPSSPEPAAVASSDLSEEEAKAMVEEAIETFVSVLPFYLASVDVCIALGMQQVIILEESIPRSMSSSSSHQSDQTQALVVQLGASVQGNLRPIYADDEEGGEITGLTCSVQLSGVGWQISLRRIGVHLPQYPPFEGQTQTHHPQSIHRETSGELINLPNQLETEQRLSSPICWNAEVTFGLDLASHSRFPVHLEASLHIETFEVWAFLDLTAIEHLADSTILPAVALFSEPSAVPVADESQKEARGDDYEGVESSNYLVQKLPIESEEDLSASSWATVPLALRPLDYIKVGMRAKLASVRLTVVNNLCRPPTPLMNATLGPFNVAMEASDGVMEGKAHLRARAKYFNRRLVVWEPLLEPWEADVSLSAGYLPRMVSTGSRSSPSHLCHQQQQRRGFTSSNHSPRHGSVAYTQRFASFSVPASPARITQDTSGSLPRQHFASCRIAATHIANLNVTEALLENLISAQKALAKAQARRGGPLAGSGADQAEELHLYWIRNDTGMLLEYEAKQGDGWRQVSQTGQEPLCLPPLKERPVDGSGLRLLLQRPGQSPWPPLTHIAVEEEGVQLRSIRTLDGVLWVACEVLRVGGIKLLRVRSTEILENKCSLPLQAVLKAGFGGIQWEQVLSPSVQVPIPIHLTSLEGATLLLSAPSHEEGQGEGAEVHTVEVKMPTAQQEGDEEDRKSEDICVNLAGPDAKHPLHCIVRVLHDDECKKSEHDGSGIATAAADMQQARGPYGHLRKLFFSPPFVGTNLLPVAIDMVVKPLKNELTKQQQHQQHPRHGDHFLPLKEVQSSEVVRLRPGEAHQWYGASSRDDIVIWIHFEGFTWSHGVKIKSAEERGESIRTIETELTEESSGQVLSASIEVTTHAKTQQICIFVPYWIINTTALPVQYAHDLPMEESASNQRLARHYGLLAGQGRGARGIGLAGQQVPYAASSPSHLLSTGPRPMGLLALLPPPKSNTERLLARAKDQLIMTGYTISFPPTARLRMRLLEGGSWSRGFSLPPATEGLVGFFELHDQPAAVGLTARLGLALGWGLNWGRARRRHRRAAGFGLSVSQHAASAPFHRTKILTVASKFLLVSAFGKPLEVKQDGTTDDPALQSVSLPSGQSAPFYWARRSGSRFLRVRLREFGWEWSGRFVPDVAGDITLCLRNTHKQAKYLLQVRISLEGSSYLIKFRREPAAFAPYRIENHTLGNLWFVQSGLESTGGPSTHGGAEVLVPYHACAYAWDEPLRDHRIDLDWQLGEGVFRREPLGSFSFDPDLPPPPPIKGLLVRIVTRGPVRALVITDSRLAITVGDKRSFFSAMPPPSALQVGAIQGGGSAAARGEGGIAWAMDVVVELQGIGISLINGTPQELLYISAQGLRMAWDLHGCSSRLQIAIDHLQVDDQMINTSSPVVFVGESPSISPAPKGGYGTSNALVMSVSADGNIEQSLSGWSSNNNTSSKRTRRPPHLEISINQDLQYDRILFIQSLTVHLVPYHIRVDGNLVAALLSLSSGLLDAEEERETVGGHVHASVSAGATHRVGGGGGGNQHNADGGAHLVERIIKDAVLRGGPMTMESLSSSKAATGSIVSGIEEDSMKIFVDALEVDHFRAQVSFTASFMVSRVLSQLIARGPGGERFRTLKVLLDVVGAALSKVENAPLRFSALTIHHAFSSDLIAQTVSHYASQALRQAYVILGTLDVLGNPVKVLANISAGLRDFIYEPAMGLGQGNLWYFSRGLFRGSASLITRVICSSFDSVQSLASSIHAGILPLVALIDDEAEAVHGTEGSIKGLIQGLGALVTEPVRGAREGGAAGLRAGVARGIISIVLRPVRGILEDTVEICRAGRAYLQPHVVQAELMTRVRPPRIFKHKNQPLSLYSAEASLAQDILRKLMNGMYWMEGLIWYRVDPISGNCALMTTKHVLAVRILGPAIYELLWQLSLWSLMQVEAIVPNTVLLRYLPTMPTRTPFLLGGETTSFAAPRTPRHGRLKTGIIGQPPSPSSSSSSLLLHSSSQALVPFIEGGRADSSTAFSFSRGLGAWLRRSIAPHQHPGLRVGEKSLMLPDEHSVRSFLQALQRQNLTSLKIMPFPDLTPVDPSSPARSPHGGGDQLVVQQQPQPSALPFLIYAGNSSSSQWGSSGRSVLSPMGSSMLQQNGFRG